MKYNIYLFIGVFAAVILFSSCEEIIEIDQPDGAERLVVEGVISTELDSSFIRLTKTLPYLDNTSPVPLVTDAQVSVNGISFTHEGNGIYKAPSPYKGIANTLYNLLITHNGKSYTSASFLEDGYDLDTIVPVFKPEEPFIEEGYTVAYAALDSRPKIKYTYFRFGYKDELTSFGKDSIFDFRVLFDNKDFPSDYPYVFELPFLRLKENDTCIMIFRTVDDNVYRYLQALGQRGGSSFFSSPPANLPTNITGDGLGLFAAYDVRRYRVRITP